MNRYLKTVEPPYGAACSHVDSYVDHSPGRARLVADKRSRAGLQLNLPICLTILNNQWGSTHGTYDITDPLSSLRCSNAATD